VSGRSPARLRRSTRHGRAHWRAWFPLLAVLGLLLLAPALVRAQDAPQDSLALRWTALGDDHLSGMAAAYEPCVADSPITASNWSSATALSGLPAPLASGTPQQVNVRGLTRGSTYYFALRVRDAAGYSVHRATAAGGSYTKLDWDLIAVAEYLDHALPPGATSRYRVTASDMSGSESAFSASVPGVSVAGSPALARLIAPAYANSSRVGDPVRIPVDLMDAGSAVAPGL